MGGMEFIFGGDMPEEMREQMRKQHEQMEMVGTYKKTALANLLDELSVEQLIVLKMVLEDAHGDENTTSYFIGAITGVIQFKHRKCPSCGGDHGFDQAHKIVPVNEETEIHMSGHSDDPGGMSFEVVQHLGPDSEEGRKAMEEYNLDDLRDGTPENPGNVIGYVCKGCGLQYVSIEDRMLRPVGSEGCHGCVHKAKWG